MKSEKYKTKIQNRKSERKGTTVRVTKLSELLNTCFATNTLYSKLTLTIFKTSTQVLNFFLSVDSLQVRNYLIEKSSMVRISNTKHKTSDLQLWLGKFCILQA